MLKFLPYENYYLITELTPEEVSARLRENIIPRSRDLFRFNTNTTRPYEGFIEHFHFKISRIIKYRNSFLPNIEGQVFREVGGSRVQIKAKMHPVVNIFMLIWMGGVTLALIGSIVSMLQNKIFSPSIFIVVAMLLFGYILSMGGFDYENGKTRQFLKDLLEAKLVNSHKD